MRILSICLLWVLQLFLVKGQLQGKERHDVSHILDRVLEKYDPLTRPDYRGKPVSVGVTLYILGLNSVSEENMDWTVDMYFREAWKDTRLSFEEEQGLETISLSPGMITNKFWQPDTFIVNSKRERHHALGKDRNEEFFRVSKNGDILKSQRVTVVASCPMDLRHFPFDQQICTLEIESYGFTMNDIHYKWAKGENSVGISSDVSLPQWVVAKHRARTAEIRLSTGNYSRLALEVLLIRSSGSYLKSVFLPVATLVIVGCISLLIGKDAIVGRILMSLLSFLGILSIEFLVWTNQPKISYLGAIDVYILGCGLFAFLVLLETVLISSSGNGESEGEGGRIPKYRKLLRNKVNVSSTTIDMLSLLVLLVGFILFNILYGMFYWIAAGSVVSDGGWVNVNDD